MLKILYTSLCDEISAIMKEEKAVCLVMASSARIKVMAVWLCMPN